MRAAQPIFTDSLKAVKMFVSIALVIISIFFPPAWFALAAYIVYLVLTKKKRRNKAITHEIQKLIATGQEESILKHVYYAAAKSFASEHGARMSQYKNDPDDNCLFFQMVVGGQEYQVMVQQWMDDDTMLKVKKAKEYPVNPSERVAALMSELRSLSST